MGLDQYLSKKTYVKNWDHNPEKFTVTVLKNGKPTRINPSRVSYIEEEIMYWRKANHLHKWFIDNCQDGEDDCRDAYVSTDQLKELLDLLEKVASNHELAPELLPHTEEFFFGGSEYDEWYFKVNDSTINTLKNELAEEDNEGSFYYSSSW